jgi:hypothetical protein
MKTLHFVLTVLQLLPAYLSRDNQRLSYLLYLLGFDSTPNNTGSRHQGRGFKSRAKYIEIDADILYHEYFTV